MNESMEAGVSTVAPEDFLGDESRPSFSLVLPFYNEEAAAETVLLDLLQELREQKFRFQLVAVNNGSTDRTQQILTRLCMDHAELKVVHVHPNQGYGWGILNGLAATDAERIGFLCGDGQTDPKDVTRILREAIVGSYDMVKARRTSRADGWLRVANSFLYNRLLQICFGTPSPDINGTPKIFSKRAFESMKLISKDWFLDAEIMIKARHAGWHIYEVPIHSHVRAGGRSKVALKAIFEFLKNILIYRFGSFWKKPAMVTPQ